MIWISLLVEYKFFLLQRPLLMFSISEAPNAALSLTATAG